MRMVVREDPSHVPNLPGNLIIAESGVNPIHAERTNTGYFD